MCIDVTLWQNQTSDMATTQIGIIGYYTIDGTVEKTNRKSTDEFHSL